MRFLLLITALFALCAPASANDGQDLLYGLAMHGTPKHTRNDTHLNYANPDAPKGGHINRAVIGSFDTLVPYTIKGKPAAGLGMITDSLMARSWDEPFTMYPLIAKGYTIAPDRSWITFTIDPEARFHDGTPITVEDVIFSFETLREYGRPNMRRIYKIVTEYIKIAPNRIQFKFGEGYDRETALIMSMMPVLAKSYWQGRAFDTTTLEEPIGNGAYKIKSLTPGRNISYERVSDYWAKDKLTRAGHNNFDTITFHYFRDDGVALEAFKSGQTDLRHEPDVSRWMNAYDIPAVREGNIIRETIPHKRPVRAKGLIFNTRRAPFDDIRVREALSLLLDDDWINKNLFYGDFKKIDSYYPNSELAASYQAPSSTQGETDISKRRTEMRKAYALLEQAGWIIQDGKRVEKDTQSPFTFEILLGAPEDEKIALHFARALEKAGITAKIHVMDSASYRARMNDYDFDMTIYYWQSSLSPGTEQILYFSCEAANQPARWNFPGICDPEIDRLADSIARSKTRQDLVNTVRALDSKLLSGHYMIPLFYNNADYYAYWKHLKHPDEPSLYGAVIETWWMNEPTAQ